MVNLVTARGAKHSYNFCKPKTCCKDNDRSTFHGPDIRSYHEYENI